MTHDELIQEAMIAAYRAVWGEPPESPAVVEKWRAAICAAFAVFNSHLDARKPPDIAASPSRYTIAEIDRMHEITFDRLGPQSLEAFRLAWPYAEDRLRTYLAAGIRLVDLEAVARKNG